MAWNEPGNGKDQDPWGQKNRQDGPPDLDELLRKLQGKLGGLFGGGGPRKVGSGSGSAGLPFGIGLLLVIGLIVWALTGIYIIDPAERGVVLQFGKYNQTVGPGPHWHIPYPIQTVEKVNVTQLREASHRALMLTKDENMLQIDMAVQYQVKDVENFLFNVRDPDYTLQEAAESALREVVGGKTLDEILSEAGGRAVLVLEAQKKIQAILDKYKTGLNVTKANLRSLQPPQEVQAAFVDATKALEDEDRYKKQAEAYSRDILPKAEGDAQRLIEESEAYRTQVTELARGETSRFTQTLKEYKKAPDVTRRRLYIEMMEDVMSSVSKVLIKVSNGGNIMYLPLDRFMKQGGTVTDTRDQEQDSSVTGNTSGRRNLIDSTTQRGRGGR